MAEIATYPVKWGKYPPKDTLQVIKSAGFKAICLKMDIFSDSPSIKIEDYYKSGLRIENAHLDSAGTSHMWLDGIKGDAITEKYIRQFDRCHDYGIKIGVAHVTWGVGQVPPPSATGLDRFKRVVEAAEKRGVVVAFENSVYPGHLRYVLDNIKSPNAMFCFDSGHHNAFSPKENYFPDYSERLAAMHLQDNDGWRDLHLIPLDGCVDWPSVISNISKTGLYKKCVTFETGGIVSRNCPGLSAEEIRYGLSRAAIAGDRRLCEIGDGYFEIYGKLTCEEYIKRLYDAAVKFIKG